MKRGLIFVFAVVAAALCAVGVVLATSELAAEPILGDEGMIGPSTDAAVQRPDTADALSLFKAGDYDGALTLWKDAVQKNTDLPPAQLIMAQLYFQARMTKQGHLALEQAAADAPNDPEVYLMMAGVALGEKDFSKASSLLQKANDLLPRFTKSVKRKQLLLPQIRSGMVGVAEARGDWAGAQTALEEWLKQDAKNVGAMQRLAFCLLKQKKAEDALAILREAAKVNPKMPPPETFLAQLYERMGDQENAGKWTKAALAAAPKDVRTRLAAGYRALALGQMDEAQKQAIAAAQMDPKSTDAKFLRGLIALCQKDYTAGELIFESILKTLPDDFAASNNLAMALIGQDDEAKSSQALEYAAANVKKVPQSPNAASTHGWVLYKLGRLDDAEIALRTAATLGKVSVDTAYFTARLHVDRGRKDEARRLLEETLKGATGASMFRQEAEELLEKVKK